VDPSASSLLGRLAARSWTLATAESLTGGRLGALLTSVPGASASYVGGVVAYATRVKRDVLGVPTAVLEGPGVVSAACASAMARGARSLLVADVALATTGVAGPDAQEGKPPGTVFVAVAAPGATEVRALTLAGDREAVRVAACQAVIRLAGEVVRLS
jgi:PncC family amidohydrolase